MDLLLENRGLGFETASGKKITALGSLQSTAVFACARILAESEASLPLILYRRMERGKERAINHRLFQVLHTLANPEMTSVELRETLMGHLVLWGNAYAEIQRDRGQRPMALWPLRPDRVDIQRGWDGDLYYVVTIGDPLEKDPDVEPLPFRNVMHLKGLGYDGIRGYSPIAMARQAVGLTLATEEFGARFFGNGARPGAVLEHPGLLGDKAHKRLEKSWNARHQGLENAHRTAILEEGMKLHEVGIPPEDAQFLETRKFQVTEIARLFRVPPHMLADLERATFSNIEQQSLDFVIHSLRPWLVRLEQAISRDLLTPAERAQGYFAEHLVDALLRGDIKTRYEAYGQGRQNGWLSANDIREMENMNPVEGGDVYLVPLNMVPADSVVMDRQPPGDGERHLPPPPYPHFIEAGRYQAEIDERARETRAWNVAKSRRRLAQSYERLFLDVCDRVIRREIADVRRATRKYLGKRTVQDFREWLESFYEEHRQFWERQIRPVLVSYAEQVGVEVNRELGQEPGEIQQFIEEYVAALAARESGSSLQQLRALLRESLAEEEQDPVAVIDERLDGWADNRATGLARDESNRAGNALAWAFYLASGVQVIRWMTIGDSCPYCKALDGRVVGIREVFLGKETDFEPEGADRPLKRRHDVRHAPLHDGCDCVTVAG